METENVVKHEGKRVVRDGRIWALKYCWGRIGMPVSGNCRGGRSGGGKVKRKEEVRRGESGEESEDLDCRG
jgi:hypothetical protein